MKYTLCLENHLLPPCNQFKRRWSVKHENGFSTYILQVVVYVAANIAWDTCLLYIVDHKLLYRDVLNSMNSAMVTIWGLLATLRVNQQNGSPSLIEFHGFEANETQCVPSIVLSNYLNSI